MTPTICKFAGLRIYMNQGAKEHNPPHFHVKYNDYECVIDIKNIVVIKGVLPRRQLLMVLGWASKNEDLLMENWDRLQNNEPVIEIKPL